MTAPVPPPTPRPNDPPADPQPQPTGPLQGAASAYVMIAAMGLGAGIGWMIDRAAGTFPGWTIGMGIFFIIAGVYQVMRSGR